MEQLVSVRSLFKETEKFAGQTIKVGGWVRNLRAKMCIRDSRDGDAQIGDRAAKWIGHLNTFRMYKLGNGTACRGGRGRRRRGG